MNNLSATDLDIIQTFDKQFSLLKSEPIVLYGIGEKTKLIIENLPEYNYVGLMDKNTAGYSLYGVDVISTQEAVEKTQNIIIVANYSNSGIIYSRLIDLERNHGVTIYHMNGTKMEAEKEVKHGFEYDKTFNDLIAEVDKHDVISFDIFDTLICRKVPYTSDVYALVEKKYGNLNGFVAARVEAEKTALKKHLENATIKDIYAVIRDMKIFADDVLNKLIDIEEQIEIEVAVPRKAIVSIYKYALDQGKEVVFTSDMYLSSEVIFKILKKCEINLPSALVISCEVGKTKYLGSIWDDYQKKYNGRKLLHIGDNRYSDIEQADKRGFSTFFIPSFMEIVEKTEYQNLLNMASSLDERIILGIVLSYLFNNPFLYQNGKRIVRNMYDIGYMFYGPMIANYVIWLVNKCIKNNNNKILFIARDGYILKRLFDLLDIDISGQYFYASRRALAVASIKDKEDIKDVFHTFYLSRKITFDQFFSTAFGIDLDAKDPYKRKYLCDLECNQLLEHILQEYVDAIIANSEMERDDYIAYIESINISESDKLAVINFVSSGVTQHFFEKLFNNTFDFYYFMTKSDMKDISLNMESVNSLYGDYMSPYTACDNSLIQHFLKAEAVFSSPDEQFIKFSGDKKLFTNKSELRDFSQMQMCHDGVEDFFKSILCLLDVTKELNCSTDLVDAVFGLQFNKELVDIDETLKFNFGISDDYAPDRKVATTW